MSNPPRYEPSMDSLKLAVELARINGGTRAAFDVAQDAALFDAYLFGDLIVALRINDGASNLPNFKRTPNFFGRRMKIFKNSLLRKAVLPTLQACISKRVKQSQNQVFTRRSHSSSPVEVENTTSDSTSEAAEESVAQPAFELSVEELLQINRGFIPEALKIRALNEIQRRAGEREASS